MGGGSAFVEFSTKSTHLIFETFPKNVSVYQVFFLLWWWCFVISLVAVIRLVYRGLQLRSSALRYQLINMRMNRYFKRSARIEKIEAFIYQCKLGDW